MDSLDLPDVTDPAAEGFSRRSLFRRGAMLAAVVAGATMVEDLWGWDTWAYADGVTVGLGSGTAPEQVHLTWGTSPTSSVVVSWSSPDRMPKPSLLVGPKGSTPSAPVSVAFKPYQDGMNMEIVYNYHATITGLSPASSYTYLISDGTPTPQTFSSSFTTAPSGRAAYVFSSFGDLGTPAADLSLSKTQWNESSDNAYYAVRELETHTPLFHLLNGDLCYANLNTNNQPEVWRDFNVNNQVSAANRPWMPCLGNHEIEFGQTNMDGSEPNDDNGYWNGADGYLSYRARYVLPDNKVSGLRGNFYSFQVGTVLFISLDADDVIYQDGGANYVPATSKAPLTATNNPNISIPAGTTLYNNSYTGPLSFRASDNALFADTSKPSYNKQTAWLEGVLKAARQDSSVDMIVVQMHQCALSSSTNGNGSDLGIRQAWIPLFDTYSVDLVVNGHDHDYERTYPVRGYVPGMNGTVVKPNPGQSTGPVDTRLPQRAGGAGPFTASIAGQSYPQTFDTSQGTVYLTLGGGGTDGPTNAYGSSGGKPQAKVITQRNQVFANSTGGFTRNAADSVEPALWSAKTDTSNAYGFAIFRVDPGAGPGQTTIVMDYYHAGTVGSSANGYTGPAPAYSLYETVAFGRANVSSPPATLGEFGTPALAVGVVAVAGAALVAARRRADPVALG